MNFNLKFSTGRVLNLESTGKFSTTTHNIYYSVTLVYKHGGTFF